MTMTIGGHGYDFDPALAVESAAVTRCARELDDAGLDALEKASLFGNVTALFAIKSGLGEAQFMLLCKKLYRITSHEMAVVELCGGAGLGALPAARGNG